MQVGKTLSWERVARRRRDGCGAVLASGLVPPLIRRCGGTFPQGKVRSLCTLPESARDFLHKLYSAHKNKIRSLAAADLATKKEERKMKKMKKSYLICLYCTNQM